MAFGLASNYFFLLSYNYSAIVFDVIIIQQTPCPVVSFLVYSYRFISESMGWPKTFFTLMIMLQFLIMPFGR